MRILGVDPGLQVTGYGVLDAKGLRPSLVEAGVIRTKPSQGIAERLRRVYQGLSDVVAEHKPDALVLEKIFSHSEHAPTAILMGHVRGVVCLVGGTSGTPLVSVASTHVKKALTGKGHASKLQIQRMIQYELGLKGLPEPPDVADAIAIALSYVRGGRPAAVQARALAGRAS